MKNIGSTWQFVGMLCLGIALLNSFCTDRIIAQEADEAEAPAAVAEEKPLDALQEQQKILADRYRQLEQKLFDLHEFEMDENPDRSDLLRRAYEQSQSKLTGKTLEAVIAQIEANRLRQAGQNQNVALEDLRALLTLLESEDRSKRLRDKEKRIRKYIEEVDRILTIQRGLRSQAENGVDEGRIGRNEEKLADRTDGLGQEIEENEGSPSDEGAEGEPGEGGEPSEGGMPMEGGEPSEGGMPMEGGEPSEGGMPMEGGEPSEGGMPMEGGEPSEGGMPMEGGEPSESGMPMEGGEPSEGGMPMEGGEPSEGGMPMEGGEPSEGGMPSEGGEPSEGGGSGQSPPSPPQPSEPQDPVQQKLKAAAEKMREAQLKLEQARREESIEAMEQAEQELAEARKELEEILRQLREEEIGRTLALLESRFRKMLEAEIRIYESTKRLDRTVPEQRQGEFLIQTGKLGVQQREVATDADRALTLLLDEGTSIAFPEVVEQLRDDMIQVSGRLSGGNPGRITQDIEEEIIDTLDYVIEALVEAQKELEEQQGMPPGQMPPGQAGEMPLVDQIQELKMIRGLQFRINKRHQRYSRLLDDPDDPVGATDDPDIREALDKLSDRQESLQSITRDVVLGKNQ